MACISNAIKSKFAVAALALTAVGGLILVALFAIRLSSIYLADLEKAKQIPFEPEAWKSVSLSQIYSDHTLHTRLYMVDDLLAKYNFTGWSQEELENLLGKPDVDQNHRTPPRIYYALGYTSDTVWLIFWLDEQGRVIRHEQHID